MGPRQRLFRKHADWLSQDHSALSGPCLQSRSCARPPAFPACAFSAHVHLLAPACCPSLAPQDDPRLTKDALWHATRRPEPYRHAMKKTIDEVGLAGGALEAGELAATSAAPLMAQRPTNCRHAGRHGQLCSSGSAPHRGPDAPPTHPTPTTPNPPPTPTPTPHTPPPDPTPTPRHRTLPTPPHTHPDTHVHRRHHPLPAGQAGQL